MKKILRILIISAVLLTTAIVFTTCKQFIDNPEEFLGYWSSEVVPTDFSIDKPTQKIGDVECIPSYWNGTYSDVTLTVKLHNPRKFSLITPTSASSAADVQKIINFPGLSPQPAYGTDYTLEQTPDKTALKLTYDSAFLKNHEWGTGNISPEITLTSTDGRKFNKKFSLNLKADTAPSLEYKGVGKSSDNKYVLIFQAKNVNNPLLPPLDHLHGDIKKLHITTEGGSSSDYTVTGINFTAKTINWTDSSKFLTGAMPLVAGYYEGDSPSFPAPTDKWLIYFKTDVAVSSSSALKTYKVRLSDRAGLVSNEVKGSTCIRKVGEIQVKENLPNQGGNGSYADPYRINCVGDGVDLEVWCQTPAEDVNILYWTYKQNPEQLIASASGEGTASPTNHLKTIRLPAPAGVGNTIDYKVQFNANKTPGFAPNAKIVYYRLKRAEVIGSSLSSPTAKWQALKDALGNASAGDVFFIEGEYTMPVGSDTMVPAANCTIRGTNNAVLNADNKGKMISVISPSLQNMTLENLTIKNGKDDEFALSASWGFEFYLKNVTVEDTKKIIESNSGDVIFENVKAHDTDSIIELGGLGHTNGNILYSYLTLQGDTDIKGTVKLIFPYIGVNYSGAIKICDKKAYTLKLDFDGYYNDAVNKQVVFLDDSVTGFSLAQAVQNITVKPNGSDKYYINNSGYLKKR
ncbi:hypothetical protein [Treponema denticola]|uniref:hypothetical protein n=1 Tax=Treponema denticola TaxID=158 RepID=UPI0020A3B885|nr:hypothetical protein [Treponema denticola]UTC84840.1 hypothetical protein E4N91_03955 [Treponema denticola]